MSESVIGGDDFFDFVFRSFFEETAPRKFNRRNLPYAFFSACDFGLSNDDGAAFLMALKKNKIVVGNVLSKLLIFEHRIRGGTT